MKVLMIEDDSNLVEAVSLALRFRWPEADLISTDKGLEGLEIIGRENVDLVILDIRLPNMNGFDVLKQIRAFSNVPVVILTIDGDELSIVKGLELGADEYITKPVGQLQLLARLRALMRRQLIVSEAPLICGPLRLEPEVAKVFCRDKEVKLTPTEYHILQCLMRSAGRLVTGDTIIDTVWDGEYPGARDAVKVYMARLRKKIEIDPGHPEIILTKVGIGYYVPK